MSYAIQVVGLVKRYGATVALGGVDLRVPAGSVAGVLGPAGAGKTTLIRILAALTSPDAGRITIGGVGPAQARALTGLPAAGLPTINRPTNSQPTIDQYTNDQRTNDQHTTDQRTHDQRTNDQRTHDQRTNDQHTTDQRTHDQGANDQRTHGQHATGQRANDQHTHGQHATDRRSNEQRWNDQGSNDQLAAGRPAIGRDMSGRPADGLHVGGWPRVLLLDEPTAGLGPHARDEVWEVIRRLAGDGTTVLFTSRSPEEAGQLADWITALDRGRVIAEGRAGELKRRIGGQVLHVRAAVAADGDAVARILHELTGTRPDRDAGTGLLTVAAGDPMLVSALVRRLDAAGIPVDELGLRVPSLDEVLRSLR